MSLEQAVLASHETTGAFNTIPLGDNAPYGLTPVRILGAIKQQPAEGTLETVIHNLSLVDTKKWRLECIVQTETCRANVKVDSFTCSYMSVPIRAPSKNRANIAT